MIYFLSFESVLYLQTSFFIPLADILRLACLRGTILLEIGAQVLDYVAGLRILCKLLSRWWQFADEVLGGRSLSL